MKHLSCVALLTLMNIAAFTAAATVAAGPATPESEIIPLSLRVYPNRSQHILGEPVQLYLLYTNLTDEEFTVRSDYFLDKDLSIQITNPSGDTWRFIDRCHMGITIPNRSVISANGTRGFFEWIVHSEVEDHTLPFSELGLHRIDVASTVQIEGSPIHETILAEPATINVIEPFREADRAVHDVFLVPEVAEAIQRMYAPANLEDMLLQVLDTAPDSIFAEHAHFLLSTIAMDRQDWLGANEHLYPIYHGRDSFYQKDLILQGIFTNFHWGDEPERALAVLEIMLELFPDMRNQQHPLIDSYIQRFLESPATE